MLIISQPTEIAQLCRNWQRLGQSIALVPTMGYFHEGHLSLIKAARARADQVVVSLFVNPAQFGPNEDLDAYPRKPEQDAELARLCGVDALFMPDPAAMYGPDHATWVDVPDLAAHLCGASRPGHFRGVCTIVLKLFNLLRPDFAFFGQKDWQQLTIIQRMAADLNLNLEIVGCPIVREPDGLAMSSRNAYLSPQERALAPALQAGLQRLRLQAEAGERSCATLLANLAAYYVEHLPLAEPDYLALVDPDTLQNLEFLQPRSLAAVAVRLGKARLIDNLLLTY